jgi:hypothetical protein
MGKNTWKWEKTPVLVQMRKILSETVREPLYLKIIPKWAGKGADLTMAMARKHGLAPSLTRVWRDPQ